MICNEIWCDELRIFQLFCDSVRLKVPFVFSIFYAFLSLDSLPNVLQSFQPPSFSKIIMTIAKAVCLNHHVRAFLKYYDELFDFTVRKNFKLMKF